MQAQIICSKITYHCETKILKGRDYDGRNTLYFISDKSLFIHNDYPKESSYTNAGDMVAFIKGDSEGLPIFSDKKINTLYYKIDYMSSAVQDCYIVRDTIPKIKWTIHKETRKIENFNCFRARGDFGGRTYNVWFTPDIPSSFGPYKLGGLPGLIVEAYAEDGMVKYTFQGFEQLTKDNIKLEKPTKGKEVSFFELKEIAIKNLLFVESLSTDEGTCTNNDPPLNYYIEKNQFTFNSDYKKARANKK